MPGANYMGGRRNAAKAKAKDATGRLEKIFFGQRRLCALSKGLSASKPMREYNVPMEESLRPLDISLGHARRKIPLNNDVFTNSFIPNPIHTSLCTPRSRIRTKKRLEAHSSGSNISRSAVLDALDVSEPMFLRGVLDRILIMPDLVGISRNRTKPAIATGRQPLASDKSSPLQRTKRKRSPSDLDEESDSLRNERSSSSSRYVQSYTYESICTPLQKKHASSDHKIADKERARTSKNLLVEDDIFPYWENTSSYHQGDYNMELTVADADEIHDSGFSGVTNDIQGDVRSSPWSSQDYRSSRYSTPLGRSDPNYMPCSNLDYVETMNGNESHACLPTSIVFRSLKDSSAKRFMVTDTYPVEEPTVYGGLFEQADPWDAIGQILGLSNTKPSKGLGEAIYEPSEIDESEGSLGMHSVVVETERWDKDLMSVCSDEISHVQHPPLIKRRLIGREENGASSQCDSLEKSDRPESPGNTRTALSQSHQVSYPQKDVEEIVQGSEDEQDCLSGDKRLFSLSPLPQDILEVLKFPDRIQTGIVELDSSECSEQNSTEEAITSKSILDIPELQELDGFFVGPSLFDGLDEDEDEI